MVLACFSRLYDDLPYTGWLGLWRKQSQQNANFLPARHVKHAVTGNTGAMARDHDVPIAKPAACLANILMSRLMNCH